MATMEAKIDEAVQGALQFIKDNDIGKYKQLEAKPSLMKQVMDAARETAEETYILTEELQGNPSNVEERLRKHLSEDRIKLIKGSLEIPTFRMVIAKKADDGKYLVQITRDGVDFKPSREIGSEKDIDWATIVQYASIVVEAVLMVMSVIGISCSASASVVRKTVDQVADEIQKSSKMRAALDKFISAWNHSDGAISKATAIFYLLKDTYSAGILWMIIESLCSNMAWYDWAATAAKITAMLIAAFATGGTALIAEIALVVMKAVEFGVKIANIVQLKAMKAALL